MLNIGPMELLVVAVVALLVLGPDKLPEAARKVGHVVAELRRMSSGFQAELRDAMQEPLDHTPTVQRSETPKAPPPSSSVSDPAGPEPSGDEPDPSAALGAEIDPGSEGPAAHLDATARNGDADSDPEAGASAAHLDAVTRNGDGPGGADDGAPSQLDTER